MPIRILITDDHGVVRQGLRMFLSTDPDFEVVGEAENGERAVALARERSPDVVLMDLLMPVMNGIEATQEIRRELPEVEVIALTSVLEDASVTGAVRAGAIGYLLKDTDSEELGRAIKAAARLMRDVRAPEPPEPLTERETGQIAGELFVSEKTVKAHVSSILMKLGVQSRTQAALHAVRTGLVSMEELGEEPL